MSLRDEVSKITAEDTSFSSQKGSIVDFAFELAGTIVEGVVVGESAKGIWNAALAGAKGIYEEVDAGRAIGSSRFVPNPFITYMSDTGEKETASYIDKRAITKVGGAAVSGCGAATGILYGADGVGAAKAFNSGASTARHISDLRRIRSKYKGEKYIENWCNALIEVKGLKEGKKVAETVLCAIPGAGMAGCITKCIVGAGVNMALFKITQSLVVISMQIHACAKLGDPAAKEVYKSVMSRMSILAIFGQHHIEELCAEKSGWIPLKDKILLM